jgi:hypothetical protein
MSQQYSHREVLAELERVLASKDLLAPVARRASLSMLLNAVSPTIGLG